MERRACTIMLLKSISDCHSVLDLSCTQIEMLTRFSTRPDHELINFTRIRKIMLFLKYKFLNT